ncbi:hypothetical protein ONE63_000048 [Megalurothrips usitatus]|uniref:Uncharacterized protein n=1 Tax=Megalurothrips usitatus TaxID=439358 RepID=A0AAV7Y439_9NEOP|nr:hypothetical protein ONE63_000048 [Megalurothrips usitatus]
MATGKFCEEINTFFQSFQGVKYVEDPEPGQIRIAVTATSPHVALWDKMLEEMAGWEFLGSTRVEVVRNWRMTTVGFKELFFDLCVPDPVNPCKELMPYLPVGHAVQDCEENFFAGLRFNGGHRMNPAAADIPSAFLRTFVRNLTSKSKKKNCLDDAAIHLFDFEELMRSLPEKPPDAQHSAEMVQEADVEEEEEELDLQAGPQ